MSGMEPGGVIYKWQVGGGWAYNRLFTVYELLCQAPYVTDLITKLFCIVKDGLHYIVQ